jgi:hypothetical protein
MQKALGRAATASDISGHRTLSEIESAVPIDYNLAQRDFPPDARQFLEEFRSDGT